MGRALLVSVIARQSLLLGDALTARYPYPWLLVESRGTSLPSPSPAPFNDKSTTRLPSSTPPTVPEAGDPLCLELAAAGPGTQLKLGRAVKNDLVIDDPTVSREHLNLTFENGHWHAQVMNPADDAALHATPIAQGALTVLRLPSAPRTLYRSVPLPAGQKVMLSDGDQLRLGDVLVTYVDPESFLKRVREYLRAHP